MTFKLKNLLLVFFLLALCRPAFAEQRESVYDRVMRTGVIHCGYWNWDPVYMVDVNTGKTTGIFKDVMDELARISSLKVEWTKEIHYDDIITDLNTGKVDAICAGTWPSATRAKYIRFSVPVLYIAINAYKRAGDKRFDLSPADMNKPGVTIVDMDGEMSSEIRSSDFPLSKHLAIPQVAGGGTEVLLNVADGKADATFTDAVNGSRYMKANPGKIQPVKLDTPLRLMPNTIALAGDEDRLRDFFDQGLQQLQNSGVIEKILRRYDALYPGVLVRVAKPYAVK